MQLSISRLRHLVYELHPPGLEQEGLAVALALALDATERDSGIEYRLDDQFASQPAMPQSAILFRIAQEALANVREHAHASSVTVTLLERDGGHAVRVADDGCGFATALEPPEEEGVRVREHACARAPRWRQPARRVRPRRRHDGRGLAAALAGPGAQRVPA